MNINLVDLTNKFRTNNQNHYVVYICNCMSAYIEFNKKYVTVCANETGLIYPSNARFPIILYKKKIWNSLYERKLTVCKLILYIFFFTKNITIN